MMGISSGGAKIDAWKESAKESVSYYFNNSKVA